MIWLLSLIFSLIPTAAWATADIPSGYFQLPAWVLVAALGIMGTMITYIWHRMERKGDRNEKAIKDLNDKYLISEQQVVINTGRLDKLITAWESELKEELLRGGYITMDKFQEASQKLASDLVKIFTDKVEALEKNISLQLENMRLSILANGKKPPRKSSK